MKKTGFVGQKKVIYFNLNSDLFISVIFSDLY